MASASDVQSSSTLGQRRASSVPNLRERQPVSPQRIVLWTEQAAAAAAASTPASPASNASLDPAPPVAAIAPSPPAPVPAAAPEPAPDPPPSPAPAPAAVEQPARDPPRAPRRRDDHDGPGHSGWRYWWRRTSRFFGYGRGNEARKDFVTLVFTLCWGSAQIAAVTLLLVAGALTSSPPFVNEWENSVCEKPLGPWAVVWCLRVLVGFAAAIYTYRTSTLRRQRRDVEQGLENPGEGAAQAPPAAAEGGGVNENADAPAPVAVAAAEDNAGTNEQPARNRVISRINTLSSFFSLAWFIVAHAFLYTSVDTCRIKAPHLWWAVFAIVCIGYVVVLEVLIVGAIIFILVPLVFFIVNVILVCMGRPPLQPHGDINPEVPKLSQRAVDRIPLVLYIPPPPEGFAEPAPPQPAASHPHVYPPSRQSTGATQVSNRSRRSMFRFLKRRRTRVKGKGKLVDEEVPDIKGPEPGNLWEDRWEKGDFPFVRLEENRAACAICLMDFEPPKKITGSITDVPTSADKTEAAPDAAPIEIVTVHEPSEHAEDDDDSDDDENLRLQDAGEGVQPLRLLSCGHVFHKTCVDPWLVDVSGRCPTCQQRVDIPEPNERSGRRRRS